MLTGGITRRETAETVLRSGVAVVGMGTAFAATPDLPARWHRDLAATTTLAPVTWRDKALASAASMALVRHQLRRIARGAAPSARIPPVVALLADQALQRRALRRYAAWLPGRA
jgi:hypothetical protein